MKKKMKRLLAMLLTVTMVLTMGGMGVMADNSKITITGASAGRTYYAYQIFSGTYSNGALTNIGVGSGLDISSDADIKAITSLLTSSTASVNITFNGKDYTTLGEFATAYMAMYANDSVAWIATMLSDYADKDDNFVIAFAEITAQFLTTTKYTQEYDSSTGYYSFSVPDGYYLIVEQTSSAASGSSYSRYMLVNAGSTIAVKSITPTLDKQIVLSDKTTADTTTASIGDTVTYVLTSSVPNMTGYSSYVFEITDTISKGLTLTETTGSVSSKASSLTSPLKALDIEITVGTSTISGIRVVDDTDTDDVSSYAYYYYTSTDNNGVTTLTIIFNNFISAGYTTGVAISVTYTAVLNENAVIGSTGNDNSVNLTYSNNPNLVEDGTEWEQSTETGETVTEEAVVYSYELDLTKVDSVAQTTGLSGAEFYLYKVVDGTTYYAIVDEITTGTDGSYIFKGWTTTEGSKSTLISGTSGELYIKGLGVGTYNLCETKAPTGYSKWESAMEIVISATTNGTGTTTLTATVGGTSAGTNTSTGIITASVTNSSSSSLPETGGIGTTIFYLVGTILVLGAAIVLVTRRRMAR